MKKFVGICILAMALMFAVSIVGIPVALFLVFVWLWFVL